MVGFSMEPWVGELVRRPLVDANAEPHDGVYTTFKGMVSLLPPTAE